MSEWVFSPITAFIFGGGLTTLIVKMVFEHKIAKILSEKDNKTKEREERFSHVQARDEAIGDFIKAAYRGLMKLEEVSKTGHIDGDLSEAVEKYTRADTSIKLHDRRQVSQKEVRKQ